MRDVEAEDTEDKYSAIKLNGNPITELRYADDTALLSKTTEGLNELMQNVKKFSQNKNLLLNAKKTKVMDSDKSPASSILIDNEALENVTYFNYLGANIEADGKITPDIRKRLAIATSKLKSMMNIWKSQSTPLKMRILKSCIFPVATYGCETWTLTKKDVEKIDAFKMKCYRKILRIPWTARRPNQTILQELGMKERQLLKNIKQLKLKYFGHVVRHNNLEKLCLEGAVEGRRGRGRPRRRWTQDISDWLGFSELVTKVNLDGICAAVELPPPPICPDLPQAKRVCQMGSAFTCLFKFSTNILQGDSLIWRQQCMTIQKMMICVAKSTSGCKEKDTDVKTIHGLLKDFVTRAGDHCPWLSGNLCTEQAPCPVTTAGCEDVLEQGLYNRQADVCTLEKTATECVKNNTLTCTKAQRNQAMAIMQRKLKAAGLSENLYCDNGKIDGHLYSLLAALTDVSVSTRKAQACADYKSLYGTFNAQFSNPDAEEFVALAKRLIDQLYSERAQECAVNTTSTCAAFFPTKSFGTLITDLMVNEDLHNTSFCAQAQALLMMNETYGDCNSELYNILQTPYASICVDVPVSCAEAESSITKCISNFGDITSLSCAEQQRVAGCVSTYLPAHCSYNPAWLNASSLCSDVVVLQATHTGRSKQYICEAGLVGDFGWKLVAGSNNYTITIDPIAADADSVPRCLRGSKMNDPIPQVYYKGPPKKKPGKGLVEFKVYGREDYKKDGPQKVQVGFTLESGSISFQLPVTTVYVNDRNIPNSVCSSINDPHLRTHDIIKYGNMGTGRFILWRQTMFAEAVVVQYSQCAKYGSCNCGVKVYAGKSSVTFDLCDGNTDLVSYYSEAGADVLNRQRMAVFMSTDLKTYSVVLLDSGTIVKVKIEGEYMNVWVTPSGRDIGATQ
ncbi:endonuclease-reverse transcriptase, partial [Elysia marginata]